MKLRCCQVRRQERGFTVEADAAKSGRARFVPLEGVALQVAERRLAAAQGQSEFLFSGRNGAATSFPWSAWRVALRRAGIKNFRPHDLRHTHGSYLAMLGKTLPEIMQALGHSTPTVALRYIHLSDVHKRRVAAEMNGQLDEWAGVEGLVEAPVVEDAERAGAPDAAKVERSEALSSESTVGAPELAPAR